MRLGHEIDHLSVLVAELKNAWSYISTVPPLFMAWELLNTQTRLLYAECKCGTSA